jgi:F-type H+-transporting ATPase subunit delta
VAGDRVAKRYAQAVFEAAKNAKSVDVVGADLAGIQSALTENGDLRAFLLSPTRGRDEKISLFEKALGEKVTALTSNLVKLMLEKRREEELLTISDEFTTLRRADEGIVHIIVTSAIELTDSEKKQIVEKVSAKLGRKSEPEFAVDPTLVGGVKVAYDNFVIDGSVKGSLKRIRESLRQDNLKQA